MAAGASAAREAEWQRQLADEHARRAGIARQMARSFEAAARSEQRLARTLIELEPLGYTLLADRARPGGRGNVDLVLVGPGGVVLIDAHPGRDVVLVAGRLRRGDDDLTPQLERLADLLHFTQRELAEIGLAPGEVHAVAAFTGRDLPRAELFGVVLSGEVAAVTEIARLGPRLSPARVGQVRAALERLFPPLTTGPVTLPSATATATATAPIVDDDGPPLRAEVVQEALLDGLRGAPREEWEAFLHPDQARLVRRSFAGPARIRGAAGTGKTVVALHRAAHLARSTGGPVLLATPADPLARVLATLLDRIAPDVADRVQARTVGGFAAEVLRARGIALTVDAEAASRLFDDVWRRHGGEGVLAAIDPTAGYWYEEVTAVLKGRGLTAFEQYAGLARHGRMRPLDRAQRAAVWELYVAYETALRTRGIADEQDLLLEAEASLRESPLEYFRAVVVDEAQELSTVMIRLLHGLVGDVPDGLTLVGDGQQALAPAGATLAEAGVSIGGRAAVLRTDFRTTAEIAAFARLVVAHERHPDLEGPPVAADDAVTPRRGARPVHTVFPSRAMHDRSLVERVRRVAAEAGQRGDARPFGDIGVLALHSWHAREAAEALAEAGIPTRALEDSDGSPTDAVRVGTIRQAKGLEFGEVLVARTPPHLLHREPPTLDAAARERAARQRRELYVAMTRARDGLWVGVA